MSLTIRKKLKEKKAKKETGKLEILRIIKPEIEILKKESKEKSKEDNLEGFLDDYEDFSTIPKIKGFQKTGLKQSEVASAETLEEEVQGVPFFNLNAKKEEEKELSYQHSRKYSEFSDDRQYKASNDFTLRPSSKILTASDIENQNIRSFGESINLVSDDSNNFNEQKYKTAYDIEFKNTENPSEARKYKTKLF